MSLTKKQKEQRVADIQQSVSEAMSVVFISYDGLTVDEVNEVRNQLSQEGGHMRVIPKRLLKIALADTDLDFDPKAHEGQIAVIWGSDAVAPAKVLHTFAKDSDHLQLLAGALDGAPLTVDEVTSLAQLPGRQELLGQLANVLSGPARGFAQVLSGVPRSAVYALQAIVDQKK